MPEYSIILSPVVHQTRNDAAVVVCTIQIEREGKWWMEEDEERRERYYSAGSVSLHRI
jgi:hypothetical protein